MAACFFQRTNSDAESKRQLHNLGPIEDDISVILSTDPAGVEIMSQQKLRSTFDSENPQGGFMLA